MRIAIVTDAWHPQPNGVVRVLDSVIGRLRRDGHEVLVVSPDGFRTIPCPSYPEIPLALFARRTVARRLEAFRPEAVHIATEGPLGLAARRWCLNRRAPFTTAYHTKFPQYVQARTGLPLSWCHAVIRRFHTPSAGVMVPSPSVFRELSALGYTNLRSWSHGVDTAIFRPCGKDFFDLPRPIFLFVGRVTVDKNLPAFLEAKLPGSKVVVGSGPQREALMRRYPGVLFHIVHGDEELARCYSAADVLVFPSRTDTFGLVILEAMACGVPVAAFPVTGPLDVIGTSGAGCLDEDLGRAALHAQAILPEICQAHAGRFSWDEVARQFVSFLAPF